MSGRLALHVLIATDTVVTVDIKIAGWSHFCDLYKVIHFKPKLFLTGRFIIGYKPSNA